MHSWQEGKQPLPSLSSEDCKMLWYKFGLVCATSLSVVLTYSQAIYSGILSFSPHCIHAYIYKYYTCICTYMHTCAYKENFDGKFSEPQILQDHLCLYPHNTKMTLEGSNVIYISFSTFDWVLSSSYLIVLTELVLHNLAGVFSASLLCNHFSLILPVIGN